MSENRRPQGGGDFFDSHCLSQWQCKTGKSTALCRMLFKTRWLQTWDTRGFLWTWKFRESSANSVHHQGKIVTCNIFFVHQLYISVKLLFWTLYTKSCAFLTCSECRADLFAGVYMEWWNDLWRRLLLQLLFVEITQGKVSLWLWKSLKNSGNIFSYFVASL